jgi:hypothetical protein
VPVLGLSREILGGLPWAPAHIEIDTLPGWSVAFATSSLTFGVRYLVHFLSLCMTLDSGDEASVDVLGRGRFESLLGGG